jgi:CO/xanthine dehydrogenase Mo-binding subunit
MTLKNYKQKKDFNVIGTNPIRHDGYDKVTGRAIYGADVKLPNLIWGEVVRSTIAHGKIKSIDVSEAEKMEGVFAVITHKDFEKNNKDNNVNLARDMQNILAKDKVLYKGHAIAAVSARDRNTAKEACNLIKVEYEELQPVSNVSEAIETNAPILIEDLVGDHLGKSVNKTNIAKQIRHQLGDTNEGFKHSDLIIEKEFNLQMVHQGYIEPHNATAHWDENDHLSLWSSTQGSFAVRDLTAGFVGLNESQVTTYPVEIGGGFGGKTKVYLPPLAALLSKKSGFRPVKMIMDRVSVFLASGPAPGGKVKVKLGVTKEGKFTAGIVDLKFEAGAFPGSSMAAGATCCLACYNIPNVLIDAFDVVVNKPKTAAYRAPGSPQVSFAVESVIDDICEKMDWDKIDFRLNNASKEGTRRADGVQFNKIGFIETLEAAKSSDHWKSPLMKNNQNKVYGRGIACGFWMNGGGKSTVDLMLHDDGNIALNEGSADIGGTRTSIAMQVAEMLGVSAERIQPSIPNTDSIGFTGTTGGSRTTYATGLAGLEAADKLITEMKKRAGIYWNIEETDIKFSEGNIYSTKDPELKLSIKELASVIGETGGPISSTSSVNLPGGGNGFGIGISDIQIDTLTGKTDVVRYTAIQDVGKAIYPQYVESQIAGGAVQGIGWALNEEYYMNDKGIMTNSSFLDYRMPTSLDLPNIEVIIVEVPNPEHPYGVRGVGEVPIIPPLATLANAIKDAIGTRIYSTPMNPGKILEVLSSG